MKNVVRRLLSIFVYCLSFIVRPRKVLVFLSYPDFSDNPYAFYKYLIEHSEYDDYQKVWILEHPMKALKEQIMNQNPSTIISNNTLRNWYYVIVSKYIFSSHNSYDYLRFYQPIKLINLWHGMPLKKIGLDTQCSAKHFSVKDAQVTMTVSSELFVPFLSSALGIKKQRIWVLGQPRIDLFFMKSDCLSRILGNRQFNSVGIWMPTFRQSNRANNVTIDTDMPAGHFNYWEKQTLQQINKYLAETNNFLILKLHPADILQGKLFSTYSNIAILQNADLSPTELYPLLGQTDYLITDYSSVYVDYDVLNKPMGFVLEDIVSYKCSRDFYLQDLEENLPGKIIRSIDDFEEFIINHKQYTKATGTLYNLYKDNNNCQRLAQQLL